jgi:hypothetical protein
MIKECLEGGSGKRQIQRTTRKQENWSVASRSIQIVVSWAIRKTALSDHLTVVRKGQCLFHYTHFYCLKLLSLLCFMYRKRKSRKNTTKGWLPKEPANIDSSPQVDESVDVGSSPQVDEPLDVAAGSPTNASVSSPPRVHKVGIRKKLTLKKRTVE